MTTGRAPAHHHQRAGEGQRDQRLGRGIQAGGAGGGARAPWPSATPPGSTPASGFYQAPFTQDWICLAGAANARIGATLTLRAYREAGHVAIRTGTSAADVDAALPRRIGELLARNAGLRVLPCPFPVPSFAVKQHWHARFHQHPANRRLREQVAALLTTVPRRERPIRFAVSAKYLTHPPSGSGRPTLSWDVFAADQAHIPIQDVRRRCWP